MASFPRRRAGIADRRLSVRLRLGTATSCLVCGAGVSFLALTTARATEGQEQRVVRVTDQGAPAEMSVAINPTDPDNIVIVSLAAGPTGGPAVTNYAHVSRDGGRSWTTVPAPNPEGRIQGDDAVVFSGDGLAFHSYISFDGIRMHRPPRANTGIFVSRSPDGGRTWETPVAVVDHVNSVEPFEDKPWLVSDNGRDSPHRGNVYVAWTRFDVYGSSHPSDSTQVFLSRSTDGGRSFSVPLRVSDRGGDAVDSDDTVEGAVPAVGPQGDVYLVWAGPSGLVFDRSSDGGWTFGEDRVIGELPGGWDIPLPGMPRHNGMPVTGVDHSPGPHRGSLYVNWIDQRHGDPDVFVVASRDGGETWEPPVRVNDDPLGNGAAQLFTWMAVDPGDGSVNVVFLERRDASDIANRVVLARSVDGGRSFASFPVEQPPFSCPTGAFYGDYIGVAARDGRIVAAWPACPDGGQLALFALIAQF